MGFIAVQSTGDRFSSEFESVWPLYEIVASETLSSMIDYLDWKRANERFVAAVNWTPEMPGIDVYAFCQAGSWTLLLDGSLVLPSDSVAVGKLSNIFGKCVSFVRDAKSSSTICSLFTQGELTQRVENENEAEALLRQLGLTSSSESSAAQYHAIATADRTDYSHLVRQVQAQAFRESGLQAKKAWWKLW